MVYSMSKLLWVTFGKTESGDDLRLIVWGIKKPTNNQVEAVYKEMYPYEYEEVGYVYWVIDRAFIYDVDSLVKELKK